MVAKMGFGRGRARPRQHQRGSTRGGMAVEPMIMPVRTWRQEISGKTFTPIPEPVTAGSFGLPSASTADKNARFVSRRAKTFTSLLGETPSLLLSLCPLPSARCAVGRHAGPHRCRTTCLDGI